MSREKTSGIYFKTSDKDLELIAQRMELANVRNRSAYIRKMCIDGYMGAAVSVPMGAWGRQPSNKQLRYTPGHCLPMR